MTTVSVAETAESAALHGFWTRSRKVGLTLFILGAGVSLLSMTVNGRDVALRLNLTLDVAQTLPAWPLVLGCGMVCLLAGGVLFSGKERSRFGLLTGGGVAFMVLGLIFAVFASAGRNVPVETLLAGTVVAALPLIYGSLSGVLCERSGVINVGIEGQFLAGAFTGAMVATMTSSATAGIAAGALSGAVVTFLLAGLAVRYQVDQVVVGVILNLLVLGLTGFLYDRIMKGNFSDYNEPERAASWTVPLLSDIPVIGPMIFRQNVFTYLAIVLVAGIYLLLFRSRWGLRTRAVGEHPAAADTVGINVNWLRFRNVVIAGLVSGVGGAFFTVGRGLEFADNMTAGKGFIALAVLIVGRWNPLGALAGALLFGFADQLQEFLGGDSPVPYQFMLMLPYLVTIVAVAGLIGRVRPPAADGKPYIKS
ncbi:MAG: ABC transporter permease [Stackebrandtia sp.]